MVGSGFTVMLTGTAGAVPQLLEADRLKVAEAVGVPVMVAVCASAFGVNVRP